MTPLILGLPDPDSLPEVAKKKRVLLVESSTGKRDLRSEIWRKLGAEVDCAADISEARCWWRPGLYDLVLIHVPKGKPQMEKFCEDIRKATPQQRIMFPVGTSEYLDVSPEIEATVTTEKEISTVTQVSGDLHAGQQRWGILEACRRISVVRCAAEARSRAMRERPLPTRDSEGRRGNGKNGCDGPATSLQEMEQRKSNEEPVRWQFAP